MANQVEPPPSLEIKATLWRIVEWGVNLSSGEWLLRRRANGGTIILVRSALISTLLWLIVVGVHSRLVDSATWWPNADAFRKEAREILPWFGAIFAGAYAGLYSRFSAQWSYLAEFYNQIMASQVQCPVSKENQEAYTKWFLAFIDDAESLHLARKPAFASVVWALLEKPGVEDMYRAAGPKCEVYLAELREDLRRVIEKENGVPELSDSNGA